MLTVPMAGQPPEPGEPPPMFDLPDFPHAWSTPIMALIDTARVGIVVITLYLVYLLAYHTFIVRSVQQRAVTASYLIAVVLSVWTQVERIGRPVSWRLPVVAVMATLGVWGALRFMSGGQRVRDLTFRSWFRPPPPQPPPPPPLDLAWRLRHPPHAEPEREDPPL